MIPFDEETEEGAFYWPSFSDLFMTLFILALALVGTIYYILIPKQAPGDATSIVEAVGVEMKNIREPVNLMRKPLGVPLLREQQIPREIVGGLSDTAQEVVKALALLQQENDKLRDQNKALEEKYDSVKKELNDKPPIIKIGEDTKEYRFATASAEMSSDFKQGLNAHEFQVLANEILRRNVDDVLKVDTIEIIGHTDGQRMKNTDGNLDTQLPAYLSNTDADVRKLSAGSNNDLGLLRSLSVRRAWNDFVSGHPDKTRLSSVAVRCYSAGQTVPENGQTDRIESYQQIDEKSRRIEVRLTKLKGN